MLQFPSLTPSRPIIQLESTGIGKSELNRLASGYSNLNSRFGKGFIVCLYILLRPLMISHC